MTDPRRGPAEPPTDPAPTTSAFQVDLRGMVDLLSRHLYSGPRVVITVGDGNLTCRALASLLDVALTVRSESPDLTEGNPHDYS